MGFGTLLFIVAFGLIVLGPKRMQVMLGQLGRAKAELDKATQGFKSQLTAELTAPSNTSETSPTFHLPSPEAASGHSPQLDLFAAPLRSDNPGSGPA